MLIFRLATVALLLALSSLVLAQTAIYRWTGAAGEVHYGDRPPEHAPYEQMPLMPPPASQDESAGLRPGERQLLQENQRERRGAAAVQKSRAREAELNRQQQAQAAERRRDRCENYKRRLQTVEQRLRAGYPARRSNELHHQWDQYRDAVRHYCD